ncbi:MAG: ABC transporter permease [Ignavibacteriales bacterium]|nr:ABC transporter permease [Ignavibacteriales bacterium]
MSLGYILKEGIAGFGRAKLASIGSIITIVISLLLVGIFYVVSTNTSKLVEGIRQRVELEAFLEEPISRIRISEIERQLKSIEGIEQVKFISKDEAANIFKDQFGEDINNVLDFNPLPPSFKIFLMEGFRTRDKAEGIHKKIMEIKGIQNIAYRRELLEFLDQRVKMLYSIGLALGVLLAISAAFLVSNTIRLTIYAKRKSVQTMKLVGATRFFVRAPFIVEGILQGLVGGVMAALIIYYLLTMAAGFVSQELVDFLQVGASFYLIIITGGIFLGFFGSAISVRRFIGETVGG